MALTQERLKEVLHYDHDSGAFRWMVAASARIKLGAIAGYRTRYGYIQISIDGKSYLSHRLVWLYIHGYFPESTIDHINRVRDDNRIANLREATMQCQRRNCGDMTTNTSGIKGVSWSSATNMWVAQIALNRRNYHLGYSMDKLEAAYHRYAAEQCLGFQDCDISSSALIFINDSKKKQPVTSPKTWNEYRPEEAIQQLRLF